MASVAVVFDQAQYGHHSTPNCSSNPTSAGTASTPVPRISARWRSTTGTRSACFWTGSPLPLRCGLLDRRLLGPHPPRQRGVAGKVDPLFDRDHGRQPELEQLVPAPELPSCPEGRLLDLEVLDARGTRPPEGVGDADADLVVAGVGRLVAEQDEVVRTVFGLVAP